MTKKIVALVLITVLILNLLGLAFGYVNNLAFWVVLIVIAAISHVMFPMRK